MNSLIKKIDDLIEEKSLLKHKFYQMWSDGNLSLDALKGYSKEYFQLVKAVPTFMSPIIDGAPNGIQDELSFNQQEEIDHIKLWTKFANQLGISENILNQYNGLEKTRRAVSELSSLMTTYEGGSCAMYSFEKEIPKISEIKLKGLSEFYGISNDEATEYFKVHSEVDIRHASTWRKVIEKASTHEDALFQIADKSVSAQNLLLDSCYEAYC